MLRTKAQSLPNLSSFFTIIWSHQDKNKAIAIKREITTPIIQLNTNIESLPAFAEPPRIEEHSSAEHCIRLHIVRRSS
ncbi:hypothetical protein EVAR_29879_1 [Eumeta japonica]|uniref:Uncharacterized protein n=1 Tax=Eumeta variegata TaxID=151549 RepID=A0A4C1V942_EUMVA|nr:hypothetical protein EVAR_29879_1 [Eumeta japonica]